MSKLVLAELLGLALFLSACSHTSTDTVRIAPTVAGQENTTRDGKDHKVRWLQRRSEFEINHDGPPEQAKVSFRVAGLKIERHVWLEHDGKVLPARETVSKSFWEGGDFLVTNTVNLHPGANSFAIVTDGDPVDVTPGRPVFLLMDGGIEINGVSK
jgi:hypothetical protein